MQETLILYTSQLRGQIELLPMLFTFMRTLRAQYSAERTLLLDLGGACADDIWHCAATEGRSMLIVMDAMGYHAANVNGYLSADGRAKVAGVVSLSLVTEAAPYIQQDGLRIWLTLTERTQRINGDLRLAKLMARQVGLVRVSAAGTLSTHQALELPPNTAPDPTIAGVVDFVLNEAAFYRKKKGAQ
jgi:hypothetical protein